MAKFSFPRTGEPPLSAPRWLHVLFDQVNYSWVWVIVRVYVGYAWVEAGLHKVKDAGWAPPGASLQNFWTNAVKIPEKGKPAINYDWYRSFLNFLLNTHSYTWFAPFVAWGELTVGIGLIVGALTGFAAFFGILMNMAFMLAGSASSNPVLFFLGALILLSWKVAGYWGADRWLLPLLGTPWRSDLSQQQPNPLSLSN